MNDDRDRSGKPARRGVNRTHAGKSSERSAGARRAAAHRPGDRSVADSCQGERLTRVNGNGRPGDAADTVNGSNAAAGVATRSATAQHAGEGDEENKGRCPGFTRIQAKGRA